MIYALYRDPNFLLERSALSSQTRNIVLCSLLYYFALSRELSFQEVVAFGNLGGVSVAKAKEVAAELFIIGINKRQYICSLSIPRASKKT